MDAGHRRVTTTLAVLATVLVLLVNAGPASAHSELEAVTPADGSLLQSVPTEVLLTFDDPVSSRFAQVLVLGPDGADWVEGEPVVDGHTVAAALRPLAEPGDYTVAFRVVSADGHPVEEELTFTVLDGADGLAPSPGGVSRLPDADPGRTSAPAVALGLAVAAVALAGVAGVGRRRARRPRHRAVA